MSNILVLADSGFGKTTSLIESPELGIKGLDSKNSYIISVVGSKQLPGRGVNKKFPTIPNFSMNTTKEELSNYRRIALTNDPVKNPSLVEHAINLLNQTPIKNIILDDASYLMSDYYMAKALSTGWDLPKAIGFNMNKVFVSMTKLVDKNFVMIAHGEEYNRADGRVGYRMKTTGKMVQEYILPEGKFDIVLIGKAYYDENEKKPVKQFVTNDDGVYSLAKSPAGMFKDIYILNDMGLVLNTVNAYYDGE